LAVAREGADFGIFASRASIIKPSSLALTVTTRAVGSRQFASHACGGGRADKVFAPRAMSSSGRAGKSAQCPCACAGGRKKKFLSGTGEKSR
jgi:hypothetical protein